MVKEKNSKRYNFHSHTYRCGHASKTDDSAYIVKAIDNCYGKYGISDHIPSHPIFYGDSHFHMHDNDVSEYLSSIANLKNIYGDKIQIYSGFEAEYDEIIENYLCSLRERTDYMILGQHYVLNNRMRKTVEYPLEYAKKVCRGIESGIFDIVAHPDVFMRYRYFISDDDMDIYKKNALTASVMICQKAKEYNIPLELNLGAIHILDREDIIKKFDLKIDESEITDEMLINYSSMLELDYPTTLFWEQAIKFNNDVLIGIDAHSPNDIDLYEAKISILKKSLNLSNFKFLPNTYDPIVARKNNLKLKEAYQNTKKNLTTVESRLVNKILNDGLSDKTFLEKSSLNKNILSIINSKISVKDINDNELDRITSIRRQELIDLIIKFNKENLLEIASKDQFIERMTTNIDKYYKDSDKKLIKNR